MKLSNDRILVSNLEFMFLFHQPAQQLPLCPSAPSRVQSRTSCRTGIRPLRACFLWHGPSAPGASPGGCGLAPGLGRTYILADPPQKGGARVTVRSLLRWCPQTFPLCRGPVRPEPGTPINSPVAIYWPTSHCGGSFSFLTQPFLYLYISTNSWILALFCGLYIISSSCHLPCCSNCSTSSHGGMV